MLISPIRSDVRLDDVYTKTTGRVLMSGIQALVRLPMVQKRLDTRRQDSTPPAFFPAIAARPWAGWTSRRRGCRRSC